MASAVVVEIPLKTWKKFERFLEKEEHENYEWINEDEACLLLGRHGKKLSSNRLHRMRREGIIPTSAWSRAVNSNYFFNKQKLMGLVKEEN